MALDLRYTPNPDFAQASNVGDAESVEIAARFLKHCLTHSLRNVEAMSEGDWGRIVVACKTVEDAGNSFSNAWLSRHYGNVGVAER